MKYRTGAALLVATLVLSLTSSAHAITYPDRGVVSPAQAPYVVSMWLVDQNHDRMSDGFMCTGSLLDAYTVIIAAHCIVGAQGQAGYIFVRGQNDKSAHAEVLLPRSAIVHASYDGYNVTNDIALVDLYYPSTATSFLKIPSDKIASTLLAKKPTLYGWGLLQDGIESRYLRKARLNYLQKQATRAYQEFDTKLQIGAGRINKNGTYTAACSGDSGGPLMGVSGKSSYILGIVSYGVDSTCTSPTPTVFTRVTAYAKWIKSQRAGLKASRAEKSINISNTRFIASKKKPLETQVGLIDGIRYRTYRAYVVTETMGLPVSDIRSIQVTSYQSREAHFDVSVKVVSKQAWADAHCGLGSSFADPSDVSAPPTQPSISLAIRAETSWRSAVRFTYSPEVDECLTDSGAVLQTEVLNSEYVPDSCTASIFPTADGSYAFGVDRSCFPDPEAAYVRVAMTSWGATDIEPGYDLWVGAMKLTDPSQ